MERIINHFPFLLKIVKSNDQTYKQLISVATVEQIRSILKCVDCCSKTRQLRDRKTLRNVVRCISFNRAVSVFLKNRKSVRLVVLMVIHQLVKLAIQNVVQSS